MKKEYFKDKTVLVTGGKGFLGSALVPLLKQRGALVYAFGSNVYDLREKEEVKALLDNINPNIVIHLAVDGGGIGYMKDNPGSVLYNNLLMNLNLMEQCRIKGIEKFVGIGSVCSYPKFTKSPFKEEDLWNGYPEETNAPYGLAKKMMLVQGQAYNDQYLFNVVHLLPINLYGPKDDFNLKTSHVVPALIRKMVEAKENNQDKITLWGSGNASREFLYVDDCANAIIKATEHYNKSEPINIGTGIEITIKELANKVKSIVEYKGDIIWDTNKPDGQPRRCLDITKAIQEIDFKAKISLEEGLNRTLGWYIQNKQNLL